jgi:thiol-disulfide isomerase/thioredoxin
MRFTILGGSVLLLSLSTVGSPAADEPKPTTPLQKYQALVKTHQQAQEEFSKAYGAAKTDEERQRVDKELGPKSMADHYAGQFLALIKEHAKDPAALDAFRWLLFRLPDNKETDQAVDTLLRDWIEDERLASLCHPLHLTCPANDRLLRAAIEKSPHRAVQGLARFGLAVSLKLRIDLMNDAERGFRPSERKPLEREAEQLLQQVIDKYADLKYIRTLGEHAEELQFELRHLGVGKTAPDIEGEDLDGKKMKLTDFRGKVVLVVFWGSWCGPCMADVPHERALLKRYEGKPFAIVGVNSDQDRDTARKAGARAEIVWRSFWDGERSGPRARRWNVVGWPTLYLLDGDGVIRCKGQRLRTITFKAGKGGAYDEVRYLDEEVDRLMKEATTKKP